MKSFGWSPSPTLKRSSHIQSPPSVSLKTGEEEESGLWSKGFDFSINFSIYISPFSLPFFKILKFCYNNFLQIYLKKLVELVKILFCSIIEGLLSVFSRRAGPALGEYGGVLMLAGQQLSEEGVLMLAGLGPELRE